jgi:hypothetical protein
MQNALYSTTAPANNSASNQPSESMTFNSHLARDRYIREQRAYGWEVFLAHLGTSDTGIELYAITRRRL